MNQKLLTIIIVSYNTAELTTNCIKSIHRDVIKSHLLNNKTEIIVVDNNSSDTSINEIIQLKSDIKYLNLIKNKQNVGFAKANNKAIEKSKSKYVLLLNSDTLIKNKAITKLVSCFENFDNKKINSVLESHHNELDNLAVLAASLSNKDGSYQPQGGSLPNLFSAINHWLMFDDLPLIGSLLNSTQKTGFQKKHKTKQTLESMGWVGGTAMLIKRSILARTGLLDENIFMYGEDLEFCYRVRNHLYDVAICHDSEITHFQSQSSTSKNAIIGEIKSYLYFWKKHKPMWQLNLIKLIIKIGVMIRCKLFAIIKHSDKTHIYGEIWQNRNKIINNL